MNDAKHTKCNCDFIWGYGVGQHEIKGIKYCSLHAAAPELLEACKAAWAELDNRYDVDEPEPAGYSKEYPFNGAGKLMRRLQAAIAKAEGR